MNTLNSLFVLLTATFVLTAPVYAEETKIVVWNAEATIYEGLAKREADIKALDLAISPDVLVLVEIAGAEELERIIGYLGWSDFHAALSDFGKVSNSAFTGLEVAIVSKIPIESSTEYDASIGDGHHEVSGNLGQALSTEKLLSSNGLSGVPSMAKTDRGTLRVDLANGLSIFPVHLKSNRNGACSDASNAIKTLHRMKLAVPQQLQASVENGFDRATKNHLSNAVKRERVVAAIKREADGAVDEGRIVVIAGDFNTAFEPGKAGSKLSDCALKAFSCARSPFPANACPGDGFDDTLAILELGLIGDQKWEFLTRNLDRTYDDEKFADLAIDHIAVPEGQSARFTKAAKAGNTFGSDHYPVVTVFKQ